MTKLQGGFLDDMAAPSYTLLCYQIIDLPEKTKANELTLPSHNSNG